MVEKECFYLFSKTVYVHIHIVELFDEVLQFNILKLLQPCNDARPKMSLLLQLVRSLALKLLYFLFSSYGKFLLSLFFTISLLEQSK